ncbi:TetR family transcriptional regulator [Glutamicibacter sp.]|uniref:TetR/AcrR family transcriptional regulator n=1 Tax=Glutamicibacter sp. TaxID=1931995 RepID=UPI0028BE5778|nr:TetR family transcriptional regulator [Glutamicibacter sp.]
MSEQLAEDQDPQQNTPAKRGRGRPRKDSAYAPLSKERIAAAALEIAGAEGYAALTMHRLAAAVDVTPRALYNYVSDRREVVSMVVALFVEQSPFLDLDPANWKSSVREIYHESRRMYRAYPLAALVPVEDQVDVDSGPLRTELMERLLAFYTALGLSLEQALALSRSLEREAFGFVLQVDYYFDRNPTIGRTYVSRAVPEQWLDRYPQIDAPLAREALSLPVQSNDELFEELIELRIISIQAMLDQRPLSD